jgi:molecular chaperone DnaK
LNQADSLIFQSEKNIKEFGEKITQEEKTILNETIDKLKQAHTIKDVPEVEKLTAELNEKWNGISSRMYQQSGGGQSEPQNGAEQPKNEDNVQDVDYTEVK